MYIKQAARHAIDKMMYTRCFPRPSVISRVGTVPVDLILVVSLVGIDQTDT